MYIDLLSQPSMIPLELRKTYFDSKLVSGNTQPSEPRTNSNLQAQISDSIDILFQEYQKSLLENRHDGMLGIKNSINGKTSKRSIPEILMEKPNPTPLRKCNDMNGLLGKLLFYITNFPNDHFP